MRKPDPAARAADPAARATLPEQRGVNYLTPPRPSIELIVEKMSVSLDKGRGSVSGARSALSHVRNVEPKLTRDEFMAVLNGLDRKDRLGDFFLINAESDILKLLVRYEVPWNFILSNWKPSIYDASLFLAGVAAGLAEDFIEGISFIAQIVASPFMDNIAGAALKLSVIDANAAQKIINDRDAFWDGIGGFIDAVSFEAIKNIGKGWLDETVEAFVKLDFYTAGNKIGRLIGTLLTLPVVWKAGKTIVRGVGKLAKKYQPLLARGLKELSEVDYRALRQLVASLPELTLQQFMHMVPLEALRAVLSKLDQLIPQSTLGPQLAAATAGTTAEGGSFAVIGDSIAVWAKNGQPLGKTLLSEARDIADSKKRRPPTVGAAIPAVAGAARKTFRKVYKDLVMAGYPKASNGAIWPDLKRYPSVRVRPNGDAIGLYKDLQRYLKDLDLTASRRAGESSIEAHHLLEDKMMKRFGISRDEGLCVALEAGLSGYDHAYFSREMAHYRYMEHIDDIYKAHRRIYINAGHPEWVSDMHEFLREHRKDIERYYNDGLRTAADIQKYRILHSRILKFLDEL